MTIKEQIRQEIERRIKDCKELKDLLAFLDTLQEESDCRFPQYDDIVEKVFGAGNLESWDFWEAKQLVNLAKEELLESLQKPDTNLEEEIDSWIKNGPITNTKYIIETAKYFYYLGKNKI